MELNKTKFQCCAFCAFGISEQRKKQLEEKIKYILKQVAATSMTASAYEIFHAIAPECNTPEEIAAVAWSIGEAFGKSKMFNIVIRSLPPETPKPEFPKGGFFGKMGEA